jgi:hypothetical protein
MRYNQFKLTEAELFELKMSPARLAKQAAGIGATVGIEFEMVVPELKVEQDQDTQVDIKHKKIASDRGLDGIIDSVVGFFKNANSAKNLSNAVRAIEWDWDEYISDGGSQEAGPFLENRSDMEGMHEWLTDEGVDLEWPTGMEADDEEIMIASTSYASESIRKFFSKANTLEMIGDAHALLSVAYQDFRRHNPSKETRAFWVDTNMTTMRGVYNYLRGRGLKINWPKKETEVHPVEAIAQSIAAAVGRPYTWSTRYHGAARNGDNYAVETDPSIQPDGRSGREEFKIEAVSPPIPLEEMQQEVAKVVNWMKQVGAYTGVETKTGLHINVSVPGWGKHEIEKLDYVKLVLMLGDNQLAQTFERYGNEYCKSAFDRLKGMMIRTPQDAVLVFERINDGFSAIASKLLHYGHTEHKESVNVHLEDGYVEFRSAGGDWMSDVKRIQDSMNRMVVALSLAVDPEAERKEYLRKFGKLFTSAHQTDSRTATMFLKWHNIRAGMESRIANKLAARGETVSAEQIQQLTADMNKRMLGKLKDEWADISLSGDAPKQDWNVVDIDTEEIVKTIRQMTRGQAEKLVNYLYHSLSDYRLEPARKQPDKWSRQDLAHKIQNTQRANAGATNEWELIELASGEVIYKFKANTMDDAIEYAREAVTSIKADPNNYEVRPA